jgi:hypothetical protein
LILVDERMHQSTLNEGVTTMLNMNGYDNTITGRLTSLFEYGFSIGIGSVNCNKFANGNYRVDIAGPSILSSATGHWPFNTFRFVATNGDLAAWQLTVMGLTIGVQKMNDVDDAGVLQGPDFNKFYVFFSCLNHKDQLLEEIINPQPKTTQEI